MAIDPIPPELRQKLFDLIDGTLPEEEFAALEKRLQEDPVLRAEYRESMEMQAFLEWQHSRPGEDFRSLPLAKMVGLGETDSNAAGADQPSAQPQVHGKQDRHLRYAAGLSGLVALTVLAGFAGAYLAWKWSAAPATPETFARATGTAEARALGGSSVPEIGSRLGAGPVRLESGSVQLTFGSGAVVALTGPANLELLGPDRVFLHYGRMTPYVPPAARGFTVLSPEGQFVDLGTEFDLQVEKGRGTQLHVIDGKVAVTPNPTQGTSAKDMTSGYAASMQSASGAIRTHITQRPLLIDTFRVADTLRLDQDLARRQSGIGSPIGYLNWSADAPAEIRGSRLTIPIEGRLRRDDALSGVILNHDFSELAGRRYTIAFKVKLPELGSIELEHWMAFVLNDQKEGRPPLWMPPAYDRSTNFRICIAPNWQVGPAVGKRCYAPKTVFARSDAAGPYQVVVRVDETGPDGPVVDLEVNGVPILTRRPLPLGRGRYLGFQSFTVPHSDVHGWGYVYDLCVSVDSEAVKPADVDVEHARQSPGR